MTTALETTGDNEVYCCSVHKEVPSIAINSDCNFSSLDIKVLYYCPISGCESFRCDDGGKTWMDSYTRFGMGPLPYVVPTKAQKALQQFFRHIFFLTVRVIILTDKEKRQTVIK